MRAIPMRPLAACVLFLLSATTAQSFDFAPADAAKSLAELKAFVIEDFAAREKEKRAPVILKLEYTGVLQDVEIVAAEEASIQGRVTWKDSGRPYPWDSIPPRQLAVLGKACLNQSVHRATILAEYCKAAGLKEQADDIIKLAAEYSRKALKDKDTHYLESIQRLMDARRSASAEYSPEIRAVRTPPRIAYRPSVPGALTPISEVAQAIDNIIEITVSEMSIRPEPVCDDMTFLRRVSLDLNGQIPSPEEVIAFFKDSSENKRVKKIQVMLDRLEYADHWANYFTLMLMGRANPEQFDYQTGPMKKWLREQLRTNARYDAIVREMLTAIGSNPAGGYLAKHLRTGVPAAIDHVSRSFLGTRIGCAQCHDHPFDRWTQSDFWGFAAFLANTSGGYNYVLDADDRLQGPQYDPPNKDYLLPPRILGGEPFVTLQDPVDPKKADAEKAMKMKNNMMRNGQRPTGEGTWGHRYRNALADYIVDPANRQFDQIAVNRIWREFFGHALVEPLDDIRVKNTPSHPQVMEILSEDFAASGRDLKRLMTIIANTKAYQRASTGTAVKAERHKAVRYAARAEVRPLTPEMLFFAIVKATSGEEKSKLVLAGFRDIEANNPFVNGQSLKTPQDIQDFYALLQRFFSKSAPEGADSNLQFEGSFTQALMMMHSDFMTRSIRDASSKYSRKGMDMTYIFALTLGRPPTPAETVALSNFKGGLEEVLWVLLNSAEFVTNH